MSAALSQDVLVLNTNYLAVNVVNAMDAFILLCRGVAEVVDVEEDNYYYAQYNLESWADLAEYKEEFEVDKYNWVQCATSRLPIPRVVRLMDFKKFKPASVRFSRRNVYLRDKNVCQYCGKKFKKIDLNLDHVTPSSKGGLSRWENIVCSCIKCNTKKANRTPKQAGMKLIRKPKKPINAMGVTKIKHHSWKHFVDAAYWDVELQED